MNLFQHCLSRSVHLMHTIVKKFKENSTYSTKSFSDSIKNSAITGSDMLNLYQDEPVIPKALTDLKDRRSRTCSSLSMWTRTESGKLHIVTELRVLGLRLDMEELLLVTQSHLDFWAGSLLPAERR